MPKEKNEAGKAISSAKGVVNEDRIKNIRAVRERAQARIKQVDTTSPENKAYLDSMTQKVYTSDKDK
jgi:hypothetical protein